MEQKQKKDIIQETKSGTLDNKELEKVVIQFTSYCFLVLVNAILNAVAESKDNKNK